jgi:CBS domain-containing protein
MLFPLERLIDRPEKPALVCVRHDETIRDALKCMIENDFTQLPVVDKDQDLMGIISEQRIMRMYYHLVEGVSLLDLQVDHCLAPAVTLPSDRDVFEALNRLKDKDVFAIVVVKGSKPVGILTDYDMTQFFRDISEGLIFVEDIEFTLRQHIEKAFPEEHSMMAALMAAFKQDRSDPSKPAKAFARLTLYEYIQLMTNERNWPKFKGILEPKGLFVKLMEPVTEIRNQLAHFRGRLNSIQRDALLQALNWLATRPKQEIPKVVNLQTPTVATSSIQTQDGKSDRLRSWLEEQGKNRKTDIRVPFQSIETLLGEPLPPSAKEHPSWWENDYINNMHSLSWLQAGWRVEDVDLSAREVTFHRTNDVLHQLFFADLLARLKAARPGITRSERASPQSWWDFGAGQTGFAFSWAFSYDVQNHPVLRNELYFDTGDREENNRTFNALLKQRESIEQEIGIPLNWDQLEGTKRGACRIYVTRPTQITDPPEDIEQAKQWAIETMLKFVDAFRGRIKRLKSFE